AMRLFWQVALDCGLHQRARACADPLGTRTMAELLARDGKIFTRYSIEGEPRSRVASPSFEGSLLPAFLLHQPSLGQSLLAGRFSPGALRRTLHAPDRYYDLNWIWFGLAAAEGMITEP